MPKPKIYLDTSTISHLEQAEKPSEQAYSQELFRRIKTGQFQVCLSNIVIDEITACTPERRELLFKHVAEIAYENVPVTEKVTELGEKIIQRGILPTKSVADSQHIAAALLSGCDYVVSWNMKHIANVKTNKNIRHITIDEGYKEILLVPPTMLLSEEVMKNENA